VSILPAAANLVEWLVLIQAAQMVISLALNIIAGLPNGNDTFDGSTFYLLFKNVLGLGSRFSVM